MGSAVSSISPSIDVGAEKLLYPDHIQDLNGNKLESKALNNKKGFVCRSRRKDDFNNAAVTPCTIDSTKSTQSNDISYYTSSPDNPYEGWWKNDMYDGQGIFHYANKDIYEGGWRCNRKHGYGLYKVYRGDSFEGMWENNKKCGAGICRHANGIIYSGSWINNKREGFGKTIFANGETHIGSYSNDLMHGFGTMEFKDGTRFEGEYEYGQQAKFGKYVYPDGGSYEGELYEQHRHGTGTYKYRTGNIIKGEWAMDIIQQKYKYAVYKNGRITELKDANKTKNSMSRVRSFQLMETDTDIETRVNIITSAANATKVSNDLDCNIPKAFYTTSSREGECYGSPNNVARSESHDLFEKSGFSIDKDLQVQEI